MSMCSISTYSTHTQCKDTVCMHCTLNTHKIFSAHPQHIVDTNSACNIFCTYSYVSSTRNINRFYSAPYHIYIYMYVDTYACIYVYICFGMGFGVHQTIARAWLSICILWLLFIHAASIVYMYICIVHTPYIYILCMFYICRVTISDILRNQHIHLM